MKKLLICCTFVLGMFSLAVNAQVVSVKGQGAVPYSLMLNASDKEQALQKAQMSAVERYFAERGEAETENFERNQDKILANLDKFILSTTVLNEQKESGRYVVAVRVEVNEAKLRNVIRGSSAAKKATQSQKSSIVYIFTGREAASVKSYDDRVVKRAEVSSDYEASRSKATRGSEGEAISGSKISTNASKSTSYKGKDNQSAKVETGGSRTRKSDQTTYRLLPLNNQRTAITGVFSQAGFKVNDPEFVLDDHEINAVNRDFSSGSDLAPSTIRGVVQSLKKANVPYLVLATLDVDAPSTDPSTGMQRVAVVVTARVLDLSSGMPQEVASVPAVQYFGLGVTNTDALNKALKDGSLVAAREIVQRLNAVDTQ